MRTRRSDPRKAWRAGSALGLALITLVSGCGYVASGTWDDEDENWERAFGVELPEDVNLVHSQYWRGAHFTYECCWYFEIAPNAEFERELTEKGGLELHESWPELGAGAPAWFKPATSSRDFEIWGPPDHEPSEFRVYVERETRRIFLHDSQL